MLENQNGYIIIQWSGVLTKKFTFFDAREIIKTGKAPVTGNKTFLGALMARALRILQQQRFWTLLSVIYEEKEKETETFKAIIQLCKEQNDKTYTS